MADTTQKTISDLIKRSKKILVLPSSPPDGDSIGSAIALYMALRKLDKEVTVISSDPVPEVFDFLPNTKIIGNKLVSTNDFIITLDCRHIKVDKIKSHIEDDKVNIIITPKEGYFSENDLAFNKGEIAYDMIITVDCAEPSQLQDIYENNIEMFQSIPVVNVDHHVSNTHFGKINYVDIMASSTTELLLPLLEELSRDTGTEVLDEDIATLLLTGIITDTGSFQNANTTPRAFEKASELIAYGARQQEIIQFIYKTKQLSQLKLWGRVLSKIQTDDEHRLVWSVVSQQDFRDTGSSEDEIGDIIDELMTNAPGAEIILLLKEKKDNSISVSVRTTSSAVDGAKIAESFGGGGHTQAAGFRIQGKNLRDAEYQVISAVKEFQRKRGVVPENHDDEDIELKQVDNATAKPEKTGKKSKIEKAKDSAFIPKPDLSSEIKNQEEEIDDEEDTELKPEVTYKFED